MQNLSNKQYRLYGMALGSYGTNTYIFGAANSKEVLIIDPGFEADKIKELIEKEGLMPKIIINTHGHIDHIGENDAFGLPVYIHEKDGEFLTNPALSLSAFYSNKILPKADKLLKDGDEIAAAGIILKVLHVPGHTPGGIALHCDDVVFTGDTLFAESVGRSDFPYGDSKALIDAINKKLMALDDETLVFPGHGEKTTIGTERSSNPWL